MHIVFAPGPNWKHLWCKIVRGANLAPGKHCIQCLVGSTVRAVRPGMTAAQFNVDVRQGEYVYICGVHKGYNPKRMETYCNNLHVALAPHSGGIVSTCVGDHSEEGAYIEAIGARQVPIPPLPRGYGNQDDRVTQCRNYQFAVAYFGDTTPVPTT